MIEIKGVSKSYDGVRKAVDSIHLEIKDGEIFGLIGPNGAGKSTLLNMMVGLLRQDEGTIRLNGKDTIEDMEASKFQFAYISDSPDHLLRLKAIEYLKFIADVYKIPVEDRVKRVEYLAKEFNLRDRLDAKIKTFSHGMRQKLMIIGALLANPKIWILDEPMTGLDPQASFKLKEKMKQHAKEGNIVLFSTHVLEVAEKLVDRIGVISHGKVLFVGTVEELRHSMSNQSSLEELFIELVEKEDVQEVEKEKE